MNIFKALFGGRSSQAEEKKEEKNFEVLKYDGVRALKMQQFGYAVQCFLHALELNSTDLECRDYLSQAYIAMGDMEKAYEQLQSISTACPDNVAVLTRLADVAYMMEDYAAMADACAKAIEVDEADPQALYLYAKAYRGLGDVPNAVAMLTKALDKYDDFEAARLLRGETLLANGDVEEAGKDADELLKRIVANEDVLMLNARVAKAMGDMGRQNRLTTLCWTLIRSRWTPLRNVQKSAVSLAMRQERQRTRLRLKSFVRRSSSRVRTSERR